MPVRRRIRPPAVDIIGRLSKPPKSGSERSTGFEKFEKFAKFKKFKFIEVEARMKAKQIIWVMATALMAVAHAAVAAAQPAEAPAHTPGV